MQGWAKEQTNRVAFLQTDKKTTEVVTPGDVDPEHKALYKSKDQAAGELSWSQYSMLAAIGKLLGRYF